MFISCGFGLDFFFKIGFGGEQVSSLERKQRLIGHHSRHFALRNLFRETSRHVNTTLE